MCKIIATLLKPCSIAAIVSFILYYFVDTTIIKNIIKDITIIIKEFININNLII